MAEEQEHMPIISLVARDVELKLSTDIAQIDPSTQADNKLPSLISSYQNNESPSPISGEQRNLLPSPIIAELNNFHEYHGSSDESLAESTNSETGDPNISIPSETSTLSYSLCNDDSIDLSVGATSDRAAASQLLIADSPSEQRGRKRKLSSATATGISSDSVSVSGYGLYVVEPVPKGLKPSPDTESLKQIKASADKYIKGCSYPGVREFYRDKLDTYFNYIKLWDGGIMRKYMKNKRGSQHCPINGKLEGLFFMCSPPDNNSPQKSAFVSKRLILPSSKLLNAYTNLYFSNFLSLPRSKTHYISLAITTCGSEADSFCQENLIELDKYNNPYLVMTEERKGVYNTDLVFVAEKKQLWVEIFYTEDVDISDVPLLVGVKNSGPRFGCTFPIKSSTPKRKDFLYNYPTNFRGYKPRLNKIRALAYKYVKGCSYTKVTEFYRNKHQNYFNDIRQRYGGKMKKYVRNDGGDPDCLINGKLPGMFFMCSPDDKSAPKSPSGSKRLILPISRLLNAYKNLYFSNFFCVRNPNIPDIHYISLVLTKSGSKADTFSQKNLLQLDKYDNPYLEFVQEDKSVVGSVNVAEKRHLLVEIFYTEDVDISDVPWEVGVRESGPRYV